MLKSMLKSMSGLTRFTIVAAAASEYQLGVNVM